MQTLTPTLSRITGRGGRGAGLLVCVVVTMAMLIAGCDERKAVSPPPTSARPASAPVEHAGTISGKIRFFGQAPKLPPLQVTGDAHCLSLHPNGVPDESAVISADGTLANVYVYVKDVPASDGSAQAPATLDQVGCQYVPHAVAVQVGQPLKVRSSDSLLHNVHVMAQQNPPMNLSTTQAGQEQTVKFEQPEMIPVRCDVHQWMRGIVGVFENPCFAVSAADGSFIIRGVPPGPHIVVAWHERFGELTQAVTVTPDGTVTQDFVYTR